MPRRLAWSDEMDDRLAVLLDVNRSTIRQAAECLGVSRSFAQRRAKHLEVSRQAQQCSPQRQAAGSAPLPIGHPISWGALAPSDLAAMRLPRAATHGPGFLSQ
jgi:hypothetical protein